MTFEGLNTYYQTVLNKDQMEIMVNGHLDDVMKSKVQKAFLNHDINTYNLNTSFRKPRALKNC